MFNRNIVTYLHMVCPKATILFDANSNFYGLKGETGLKKAKYLEKTVKKFYDDTAVIHFVDNLVPSNDVTAKAENYTIQKCGIVALDSHDYIPRWIQAITYIIPDVDVYFFSDWLPTDKSDGFNMFVYAQDTHINLDMLYNIVGLKYNVLGEPWFIPEPIINIFPNQESLDRRLSQMLNVTNIGGVRNGRIHV